MRSALDTERVTQSSASLRYAEKETRTKAVALVPDQFPDEFLDLIRPGVVVAVYYGDHDPNNEDRHIRAVVDDQVIYRVWKRSAKRWRYEAYWIGGFYRLWRAGNLTLIAREPM